jgi:hypothetical protein
MKRFMILAALLASIHAAGAEDAPSRSRIQDITKGAGDLVPSMPSISMPALPSMPSVSLPSMPDFSIPDFSGMGDTLMVQFNAFTQQVADSLPLLEEMGYEVSTFRVQWGLPPKAKLRLRSKGTIDPEKIPAITAKATGGMMMKALVLGAAEAKRIQRTMKFGTAIIDVDFALQPKVRMSFSQGKADKKDAAERDVEDLDLACGQAFSGN